MKAIVFRKYGTPDELKLADIPVPVPQKDEVLIRLHAASINSWDWDFLRGKPRIYRLLFGLRRPKINILGCDIAGRVVKAGKNVKDFQAGDEVFGDISGHNWGGFAEYVCAPESILARKPKEMTFGEAAATPQAALLALQGLRDTGKIKSGQKLLINGAGGGVGSFAIQLAKMYGAEVTAVDKGVKLDFMKSLGADHVIDYTREDFTKNGLQYDLVFINTGSDSLINYKRSLSPAGTYVMAGGSVRLILQCIFTGSLMSKLGARKYRIIALKPNRKDLETMAKWISEGKIKPAIDKQFPLEETPAAFRYFGEGEFKGKVVITMQ